MKTKLTNNLKLGKTYLFMGYNWTVCELVNDGRTAVLQSHGVTSGAWPGFKMAEFGNGDYYADSIYGQDISAYDHKLKELYNAIKDVEDKSATYGKGLYLVSKEKVGFTKCGKHGSGYYWTALKEAAMNYQSFEAASNGTWLGTVSGSGNPLCVDSNGGVYNGNLRSSGFVVAPAFNLDLSKVEVAGDEIIKNAPSSFEHDDNCHEHQLLGKTYKFAGYKWTACELINKGKTLVIQSHGVTHGAWPGYVMPQFGNGNFYAADIDGEDISAYDDKMQALYEAIKDAEDSSTSYGKGLFLISKEKAGFTEWCEPGSGDYWQALKKAAGNASSFGCPNNHAWLGTVGGSGSAWCVYSGGNVYDYNSQNYDYVVAPAFNLDVSKVEVDGDEIIIKGSDNNDQPENQSNPIPYRSIWKYGMDFTKNGETFHLNPDMVSKIYDSIKEDFGRNCVSEFTDKEFTREQYIAVYEECASWFTAESEETKYLTCEKVLGDDFDKVETWVIKTMFTSEYESCTVRIPETLSSEKEAWNKVKEIAIADQDINEVTEVKYDRNACQVTVIHANETVYRISAEKK